jgi:Tfp pilus assembly protein PilF
VAYNIGMTYLRCGVRDKARQCFATALELSPDMEKAKEAMASL